MIKIGNLKLKNRVFLAPMLEYNDIAFRMLCKKAGACLVYTGMANPLSKQKLDLRDKPAIQLFCSSDEGVSQFVRKHDSQVSLWDFNLGCPSEKAENCNVGAYLTDLKMIDKILKTIKENTRKPVTIKIRKSENTLKIVKIAEKYCSAICIHPRTLSQQYSGNPDVNFALKIKKKTKLPIIYSGNVDENNCNELLNKFDFVMIGRKVLGNPGIFSKINGKKVKTGFSDYLKLAEKYKLDFNQIKIQALAFTKNKFLASKMRQEISRAKTIKEIKKIFVN